MTILGAASFLEHAVVQDSYHGSKGGCLDGDEYSRGVK
jgi:hypothetical protein